MGVCCACVCVSTQVSENVRYPGRRTLGLDGIPAREKRNKNTVSGKWQL